MRTLFTAAVIGLAAPAAAVTGEDIRISLPPLAAGEALLETDGEGFVRTPADFATISAALYGSGDTREAASRSVEEEVRRVSALAIAMGASPSDIRVDPSDDRVRLAASEGAASGGVRQSRAARRIVIRLRDVARAAELHRIVTRNDPAVHYVGLVYGLDDDAGPRREARRLALAAARADAEAYAAALGMRIVRTLRISERDVLDFPVMPGAERSTVEAWIPSFVRRGRPEVETAAIVGVDYVVAPR